MSRHSKRTPERVHEVVSRVQEGMPVKEAARAAGINPTTLWRWRQADETLDLMIERARAMFIARQLSRVDRAGEESWKAAAWLLERRSPSDFGRRVEVAVEQAPVAALDPLTGAVITAGAEPQSGDEADAMGAGAEPTAEAYGSTSPEPLPEEAAGGPLAGSKDEPTE